MDQHHRAPATRNISEARGSRTEPAVALVEKERTAAVRPSVARFCAGVHDDTPVCRERYAGPAISSDTIGAKGGSADGHGAVGVVDCRREPGEPVIGTGHDSSEGNWRARGTGGFSRAINYLGVD